MKRLICWIFGHRQRDVAMLLEDFTTARVKYCYRCGCWLSKDGWKKAEGMRILFDLQAGIFGRRRL